MEEYSRYSAVCGLDYKTGKGYGYCCKATKDETIKAVIHRHGITGQQRVYFRVAYNKVAYKRTPWEMPTITPYKYLTSVLGTLKDTTPVYYNEEVLWDGGPCEGVLYK